MSGKKIAALAAVPLLLAALAAAALRAQEAPPAEPMPPEPVLGVLASTGNRAAPLAFLDALSAPRGEGEAPPRAAMTLFVPGPEQLHHYGDKNGVLAFVGRLPRGSSAVRLLVRDATQLERFADKAPVLRFLAALAEREVGLDLMILDLPGLARLGRQASLQAFLKRLPPASVVRLYTTPREVTRLGDDADVLGFLHALTVPVEVHLDDPLLPALLQQWRLQAAADGGGEEGR